ncbi:MULTISPECIES: hypothetical protein [unclassified Desulfovibrio]|uniref:Uncharacterized protein n=1 Tax=Desulfovibrio desulfuricans (strain ATCC 27774 / DSM 6949 / MB) TaxID=525146 RepID=B8J485_DESDA
MKKIDINDFCDCIAANMPYEGIKYMFNIKTKEQFKRYLYDASAKKGEIINYEFPKNSNSRDVSYLKDGSIKINSKFVNKTLGKIMANNNEVNMNISFECEAKRIVIEFC